MKVRQEYKIVEYRDVEDFNDSAPILADIGWEVMHMWLPNLGVTHFTVLWSKETYK